MPTMPVKPTGGHLAQPAPTARLAPTARSAVEHSPLDAQPASRRPLLWIGWRRRAMVAVALLGCLGVFLLARWLAGTQHLDAHWTSNASGQLMLQGSPLPQLEGLQGRALMAIGIGTTELTAENTALRGAEGAAMPVDASLLQRSPRWQVDDAARARQTAQSERLSQLLATGTVRLHFDTGEAVTVPAQLRGYAGLGLMFWPLAGLAWALLLLAAVVMLARPDLRNGLFLLMSLCQAGNLLFIALETLRGLGLPESAILAGLNLPLALDACTGAAVMHAFALHPHRLPQARLIAAATWISVVLALALLQTGVLTAVWWWAQGLCLALGVGALAVISVSYRHEPNPFAVVMRRLLLIALTTLALVTVAVAASARRPDVAHGVAVAASVAWYLFLASLLLLTPFLARSRELLREFAMLAGISTLAASADLLFVAVFSFGPFTSLAVAVFVALAVYAGARQFILDHMLGRSLLTTERTFDHLYRAAREVQARPQRHPQALAQLLRDLFEPLEMDRVDRCPAHARVLGSGSALVVPMQVAGDGMPISAALQLRYAQRGKRLFTHDDARLADRVVEQLRRAMAYDQAVERGRHEERQRLAQDLHDDIGARLLTMMYQAPNPALQDYIRHTLQDLKTLTRGLAASEHRLSHAAAEWKADLSQRLSAAQAQLGWALSFDVDLLLSVAQWSALTRVLRELVSNSLYHGNATRIDVSLQFEGECLRLSVADDGRGRAPQAWAHGLGLGGVRKRVKLLGGQVAWRENEPRGIVCEVRAEGFQRSQ